MLTDDRRWKPSGDNSLRGLSCPDELISTQGEIMSYKTLHGKLEVELHEHLHNLFIFVINSFITKGSIVFMTWLN
jgi:hypothetical protein